MTSLEKQLAASVAYNDEKARQLAVPASEWFVPTVTKAELDNVHRELDRVIRVQGNASPPCH
jgi:ABC-type thiamine transport system substrate-binding protein